MPETRCLNTRKLYVFFAKDVNAVSSARFPRYAYHAFLRWLIAVLSRSPLIHCSVGTEEVVLEASIGGIRYWPFIAYVLAYPGLVDGFEIEVDQEIVLDGYPVAKPISPWPTILRWITRGRVKTLDCGAVTAEVMRKAGLDVPRWATTPQHLHDWLESRRYRREQLCCPE